MHDPTWKTIAQFLIVYTSECMVCWSNFLRVLNFAIFSELSKNRKISYPQIIVTIRYTKTIEVYTIRSNTLCYPELYMFENNSKVDHPDVSVLFGHV